MRCVKAVLMLMIALFFSGCGELDLFVMDELAGSGPSVVLLGEFTSRDMGYDPFLAEELREAVGFAFFRRGYGVVPWKRDATDKKAYDTPADAAALCAAAGADLLITAVISRKESGSFASRRVYYSVSFIIRNRNGTISGRGDYADCNVDEPVFVKKAAESFAGEFTARVKGK